MGTARQPGYRIALPGLALALAACNAQPPVMQRELGDFELKLGTSPTRSMAQGLIQPARLGAFHGGLDLTHAQGWYLGQWAPSLGISDGQTLELDTYLGYRTPHEEHLGYELGLIRYSFPALHGVGRHEAYGGLTFFGHRLGAAYSQGPSRTDSTLLLDLDLPSRWKLDLTFKYAHHRLGTPAYLADGSALWVFDDWSLDLSRRWLGLDMQLRYSDSDLSGPGCVAYSGQNAHCEALLLFSVERPLF